MGDLFQKVWTSDQPCCWDHCIAERKIGRKNICYVPLLQEITFLVQLLRSSCQCQALQCPIVHGHIIGYLKQPIIAHKSREMVLQEAAWKRFLSDVLLNLGVIYAVILICSQWLSGSFGNSVFSDLQNARIYTCVVRFTSKMQSWLNINPWLVWLVFTLLFVQEPVLHCTQLQ